jgi:EccD-like transmembrane domain
VLHLSAPGQTPGPAVFDDMVDAVADTVGGLPGRWQPAVSRRLAAGTAAVAYGCTGVLIGGAAIPWPLGSPAVGALALFLLLAGMLVARGDAGTGALVAAGGLPAAAVAGAGLAAAGRGAGPGAGRGRAGAGRRVRGDRGRAGAGTPGRISRRRRQCGRRRARSAGRAARRGAADHAGGDRGGRAGRRRTRVPRGGAAAGAAAGAADPDRRERVPGGRRADAGRAGRGAARAARQAPSPYWSRTLDFAEFVLVAALLPVALAVTGAYARIRGISG